MLFQYSDFFSFFHFLKLACFSNSTCTVVLAVPKMCMLYHLYLKRYSNEDRCKYVLTKVCTHTGSAQSGSLERENRHALWTTLKSCSLKALLVSWIIAVLQKLLSERRNFFLSKGSIQLTCVEGNYRANTITTTFLSFWMFSWAYVEPGDRWMRLSVWTQRANVLISMTQIPWVFFICFFLG